MEPLPGRAVMRLLAVVALLTLSGCAVQYESHETSSHPECFVNGERVPCGAPVCTFNGKRMPCSAAPTGPNETIAIHDRLPLTQGLDHTWRFSVHPGAQTASVRVSLAGYEGTPAGAAPARGCIEWSTPRGSTTSGACGQSNVQVAPAIVAPGIQSNGMFGGWSNLQPGDYRLAVTHSQAAADLVVQIAVDY